MKIFADWCIKNEAKRIEASLRALLPYVDEAVCVDSGSTDGTLEIIEKVRKDFPHLKPTIHVDLGPNIDMSIARNAGLRACPPAFWKNETTWYMNPAGDEVYDDTVKNLRATLEALEDKPVLWVYTYWRQWGINEHTKEPCVIQDKCGRPGCYRHVDGMYWDGIWNRERIVYPRWGSYFPIEANHNHPWRNTLMYFDANVWYDHYGWADEKREWRKKEYDRLYELEKQGVCPHPTR